jgi:methylmalonyl-CoA mutase N-terminal domain/subunit
MTDQIEKEAEEYINKIDSIGGMVAAIESGYVQTEIQKASYKFEKEVESGDRIIVGRNKFQVEEDEQPELLKIDIKVQEEQIKFLHKVKSERNNTEVELKLNELLKAAKGDSNLMPFIIDAARAYASVGEICNTLRAIYGEYKESVVI